MKIMNELMNTPKNGEPTNKLLRTNHNLSVKKVTEEGSIEEIKGENGRSSIKIGQK